MGHTLPTVGTFPIVRDAIDAAAGGWRHHGLDRQHDFFIVEGVSKPASDYGFLAVPGLVVEVETGGAFSAGALLETTSTGRVILRSSGTIVMRALEASSGTDQVVEAVFTS